MGYNSRINREPKKKTCENADFGPIFDDFLQKRIKNKKFHVLARNKCNTWFSTNFEVQNPFLVLFSRFDNFLTPNFDNMSWKCLKNHFFMF